MIASGRALFAAEDKQTMASAAAAQIPDAAHEQEVEYGIAVIGSTGCGKTSLIRKGMKPYNIGDETVRHVGSNTSVSLQTGSESAHY